MKKRIRKVLFLVLIILIFFGITEVEASGNVYGWAWSENIGWISFNSDNCDSDRDGKTDTENYPQCPLGSDISDYGVNIEEDGMLSGYAWAGGGVDVDGTEKPTIGWIRFDPEGPYPQAPNYSACLDLPGSGQICDGVGDYKVSGWARACSVFRDSNACSGELDPNRGGWDGWINLRDMNYKVWVDVNVTPAQFHNWAWGGNSDTIPEEAKRRAVVGWISFNCAEGGNCGESDYKVLTILNRPPRAESMRIKGRDYCVPHAPGIGFIYFEWVYLDDDEDLETRFQFQIDDNKDFSSPEVDRDLKELEHPSGTKNSQEVEVSINPGEDKITFGKPYYWRVKVYDSRTPPADSGWVLGESFETPSHAFPSPDFEWSPQKPLVRDKVEFSSAKSICYDSSNNPISCSEATFSWTMPGVENRNYRYVDGTGSDSQNPKVMFLTPIRGDVILKITDDVGTCSIAYPLNISFSYPKWKEISPFSWLRNYFASLVNFFLQKLYIFLKFC